MAVSGLILRAGVGPEATITTLVLRGLNAAPSSAAVAFKTFDAQSRPTALDAQSRPTILSAGAI